MGANIRGVPTLMGCLQSREYMATVDYSIIYATINNVGHMPREISRISWYCLERGTNSISYKITDKRQRSEKGLEVPCTYVFSGKPSHIHKLIDFF